MTFSVSHLQSLAHLFPLSVIQGRGMDGVSLFSVMTSTIEACEDKGNTEDRLNDDLRETGM